MLYNYRIGLVHLRWQIRSLLMHFLIVWWEASQKTILHFSSPHKAPSQYSTLYQMTTFAWIVKPKARCSYSYTQSVPFPCTSPHRFIVQPLLYSSLLMKLFFVPRSKAAVWEYRRKTWVGTTVRITQVSVVWGFQYAQAESQVPVVFCAVLLKVFSGHTLRRALFKFHIPETTFFSCPLRRKKNKCYIC